MIMKNSRKLSIQNYNAQTFFFVVCDSEKNEIIMINIWPMQYYYLCC